MVKFTSVLKQFAEQGEKTGWTYIEVPADIAQQLKPGNKKTFRVKGRIEAHTIKRVALMPMGNGSFILPVNAEMRKGIQKRRGATVEVQLQEDKDKLPPPAALLECLADEPAAKDFFESLTEGHKNYFANWINTAKTEPTKIKRIALAVDALSKQMDFGAMLRNHKEEKRKLM